METKILNLIDFEKVNILLEGFNKTTSFVTAILDLEGNVLSQSGWRQICTQFHRVHPETAKKCTISDTELAGKLAEGEKYHFYKCLNGMVDVAVPIVINGEHIANLFSGQFFFEEPEKDFFIQQAKKYKFDTKKYIDVLEKVPVVSEEKVKTAMDFLLNMTHLISEMGAQKQEQVELNKALAKSEEQFRLLYNNSPDMYVSVSPDDATIIVCNDTLLKETGYTKEEVIGSSIFSMYHQDCMEKVKVTFQQFAKTGEVKNKDLILKRKNGSKIDVSLNVYGIRDEAGKVIYSMSSWRDITGKKKIEAELTKTNVLLQASIESPKDMIILSLDHEYRYMYFNRAHAISMQHAYGKTPQFGDCIFDLINSNEEIEQLKTHYNRALNGESHVTVEEYGDKTRIYYETQFNPIYNDKKEIIGVTAFAQDISDRKENELALANKNNYIESIMENMPIGFAVNTIDDGEVKYMNKLFEDIYGWSGKVLTNTSIFFDKVFPDPVYREKMKAQITTDMQSGDPERMQWNDVKIVTNTGEERFVHAINISLIEQNLMISTVQDTTKQKLAEDELAKHRAQLEELVKARTIELEQKYTEIERINKLFVGRELRMVELKKIIKELENKQNK